MTRKFLIGAILALSIASPAAATEFGAMTETERQSFRDEVRAYLLENPEVLMEAIAVLEERQAQQQVTDDAALVLVNARDIFADGYSWQGGNPDGDVTLVEFMDYRCSYCRKAYSEVDELIRSDGNIRFVVKEFPILGEASELSSRFAIATQLLEGDDAYKQVHDALITFRGNVTPDSLDRLGRDLGLETDPILAKMTSDEVSDVIQQNRALAQRLQISGTPTFVMADQMLRGYVPLSGMQQIVEEIRAN